MKSSGKIIITCAITGGVHTPTMSPYLPITADEIASQSIAAAEAGASILHLHARNPIDGRPSQDPDHFQAFLPRIKQQTDAVLNLTTGGGLGMSLEERMAPAKRFKPELASLNMGSMNFSVHRLANKFPDDAWHHAWEKPYIAGTKDLIYPNTFGMIERVIEELSAGGTRFEFECYDMGHLYNLAYFVDMGLVKPPFLIQCIFGVMGGIGPHYENLFHMKMAADRLFGDQYHLSCLATGKFQMNFLAIAAILGGSVRVGLEDSLYIERGKLALSNAQQVLKIRRIVDEFGLAVATPEEARTMLDLKGADLVNF